MRLPLLASLAILAALPAAAQGDAPYRALGTEPGWSLTIDRGTMRYQPAGGRVVQVARPRPIPGFNGERYETHGMTVDITHMECSDRASGRTFHDTVTVTLGRRTLRGCGGALLSEASDQASLLEGEWAIQSIQRRRIAARTTPRIAFAGQRISGNATCNRFNGSFRFERGHLTSGPLATTRMACLGYGQNAQETAVLRILAKRLSVSRNRGGKLVLTSPQGETLTLVRAPTER